MRKQTIVKKHLFNYKPKNKAIFILFDFEKPLRKSKHMDTDYVYYGCRMLKCDGISQMIGKHSVQLPMKTAWLQLYDYLEQNELIGTKDIKLEYTKLSNHRYLWVRLTNSNNIT